MAKKRIYAFLIDFLAFMILGNIVIGISQLIGIKYWYIGGCLLFALFLCKDSFTGQSLGKFFLNIIVIHNKYQVKPIRALFRNLSFIIWPIELVYILLKDRRLIDLICSCEVISTEKYKKRIRLNIMSIIIWLILSIALITIIFAMMKMSKVFYLLYSV